LLDGLDSSVFAQLDKNNIFSQAQEIHSTSPEFISMETGFNTYVKFRARNPNQTERPRASFVLGSNAGDNIINAFFWVYPDVAATSPKTCSVEVMTTPDFTSDNTKRFGLYQATTEAWIITTRRDGTLDGTPLRLSAGYFKNQVTLTTNGRMGFRNSSPTSSFHLNGSFATAIKTISANYALTETDYTILVDASVGAITVTLPDATTCAGRIYVIKKKDSSANTVTTTCAGRIYVIKKKDSSANTVTISSSNQTIDGLSTQSLTTQYQTLRVQSDGTNWWTI